MVAMEMERQCCKTWHHNGVFIGCHRPRTTCAPTCGDAKRCASGWRARVASSSGRTAAWQIGWLKTRARASRRQEPEREASIDSRRRDRHQIWWFATTLCTHDHTGTSTLPISKNLSYSGSFPFSWLQLNDSAAPVDATLFAWSPMCTVKLWDEHRSAGMYPHTTTLRTRVHCSFNSCIIAASCTCHISPPRPCLYSSGCGFRSPPRKPRCRAAQRQPLGPASTTDVTRPGTLFFRYVSQYELVLGYWVPSSYPVRTCI